MKQEPDLAALIGSRICHDLIGPIGAIGNGVELLMLETGTPSPELALIAESVAQATARIRFFRVAYGAAGSDQRIARSDVVAILDALTAGGRLQVEWTSAGELSRSDARLAFLLFQCLESAMAYGGRVTIEADGHGLRLTGSGPRMKIDSPWWETLREGASPAALPPAEVHFALAAAELRDRGRALSVTLAEDGIRLEL